jgi:hypothetical protein
LEVSRREAREIESILALIRGNDAQSLWFLIFSDFYKYIKK